MARFYSATVDWFYSALDTLEEMSCFRKAAR
jgi:hypothetical protein